MSVIDLGQLNKAVTRLRYRLEGLESLYPELTDTAVRERMHHAIYDAFSDRVVALPDDFGMYSPLANVQVRNALQDFIGLTWHQRGVLTLHQRLSALEPLADYIGLPAPGPAKPAGMNRSFIHYRRAWYAQPGGLPSEVADEVKVYLSEDDHTVCSLRLEWVPGGDGLTARLVVFNDEWRALTLMPEVLQVLADRESVLTEPSRFCKLLTNLGYEDATPFERAA